MLRVVLMGCGIMHCRSKLGRFSLPALAIALSSCSSLDPGTDTCSTTPGCFDVLSLTPDDDPPVDAVPLWEQDPRWACLAPDFTPEPVAPSSDPVVNLTAVVLEYGTLMPVPGLRMFFCLSMDPDCEGSPPTAQQVDPMAPLFNVQVPTGFEGYVRMQADGLLTLDYYLLAPILTDNTSRTGPTDIFTPVSETALEGLISDMGIEVDRSIGMIAADIRDCDGVRVEGARLRLADGSAPSDPSLGVYWAINNRFPVVDADTDADGIAGFMNVPEGTIALEATVDGQAFGKTRLRVRGNRITSAQIRPWYLNAN